MTSRNGQKKAGNGADHPDEGGTAAGNGTQGGLGAAQAGHALTGAGDGHALTSAGEGAPGKPVVLDADGQPYKVGRGKPPLDTRFGGPRAPARGTAHKFDQWRKVCRRVLNEIATGKDGQPILIDGQPVTNLEMIVRQWIRDPRRQPDLIEAAFGKVPTPIHLLVDEREIDEAINAELARLAGLGQDQVVAALAGAADATDGDGDPDV